MNVVPLQSSVALAAGYDEDKRILRIQYSDGALVDYFDVPPLIWAEITTTSSVGRYIARVVKPNYRFEYAQNKET